jgi:hypothetical protein
MVRSKRCEIFESDTVGVYHCYNRIVRRSFLCGVDPHCGRDFSYRREWLYQRLRYLADYFAIDVMAYAILSNHFHVVLRNRPDLVASMSDREVVTAWLMICPKAGKKPDGTAIEPSDAEIRVELADPNRVRELRERLSNPSWLMRQLCQYMGIRCNAEDKMRGHFWEARFGMKRLLDEEAVLACLAYVDLNPIRASLADDLKTYQHVSIGERLRTLDDGPIDSSSWLAPIETTGECDRQPVAVVNRMTREELGEQLEAQPRQPLGTLPIPMDAYVRLLRWLAVQDRPELAEKLGVSQEDAGARVPLPAHLGIEPSAFTDAVLNYSRRYSTAVGCPESLKREARRRGRRRLRGPGGRVLQRCGAG